MEPRTPFNTEFCDLRSVVDQASPYVSPYYRGLLPMESFDTDIEAALPVEPICPRDFLLRAAHVKRWRWQSFVGVRQRPLDPFVAKMKDIARQVRLWLGTCIYYNTVGEAARAYNEAALALIRRPRARTISVRFDSSSEAKGKRVASTRFCSSHHQQTIDIVAPEPLIQLSDNAIYNSVDEGGSSSPGRQFKHFFFGNPSRHHPGEPSTRNHCPDAPELCVNILNDDPDHRTQQMITYETWKEHIDQLKKSRLENFSMAMMTQTTLGLAGQAVSAVMTTALTSNCSSSSVHLVVFAILLGLSFTLAGIGLREKRRVLSIIMTKIGAIATTSAIVISLASHLPPLMGWIVGPLAFLVIAMAVILA